MSNFLKNTLGFFVILSILLVSACQQDDELSSNNPAYLLPENLSTVFIVKPQQLMEKADFEAVKDFGFYAMMLEDASNENEAIAEILEDPASSGIDLSQNFYISIEQEKEQGINNFGSFVFALSDAEQFEKRVKQIDPEISQATSGGNQYYHPKGNSIIAWNENYGIIGVSKNEIDIKGKVEAYFTTEKNASILSNTSFKKCLSGDYDVANWLRGTIINENEAQKMLTSLLLDEETLENSAIHNFLNFEDGKIRVHSDFYVDKKLTVDLNTLFKNKVKTDFSKIIPAENQVFLLAVALEPRGINQLLIEKYSQGITNQGLDKFGIKTDELLKAFQGDVAISIYHDGKNIEEDPQPLAVAKIEDEKTINSIFDKLIEEKVLEKKSNNVYIAKNIQTSINPKDSSEVVTISDGGKIILKDGFLFVAENAELLDQIENGNYQTGGAINKKVQSLVEDNIAGCYGENVWANLDSGPFRFVPITSIEAFANRKNAEGLLEMKDKNSNSLKQLFLKFEEGYQEDRKKREERRQERNNDQEDRI